MNDYFIKRPFYKKNNNEIFIYNRDLFKYNLRFI